MPGRARRPSRIIGQPLWNDAVRDAEKAEKMNPLRLCRKCGSEELERKGTSNVECRNCFHKTIISPSPHDTKRIKYDPEHRLSIEPRDAEVVDMP